ncbi:hypothetical protein MRX96_025717 [Rhipicephalus microplus]
MTEHPWKTLHYHQLVRIVRQSDAAFLSFFTRLGDGLALSEDEVTMTESRFVPFEQATTMCPNGIRLFYSNADVDCCNAHCLEDVGDVLCHSACDKITGYKDEQAYIDTLSKMANVNTNDIGGCASLDFSERWQNNMIAANIDVSDGLIKDNMGTLRYIEHDEHANIVRL